MSESSNDCELCSLLKNLDSDREPVYNGANLSCQQLSSSSEWVIVDANSCRAGTEPTEADAFSFTTSGTWSTQGDSAQVGASWVELVFLPSLIERQEVSMSGNEGAPSIHHWVNAQGPWNSVEATDRIRAQQRCQYDLELDYLDSPDGAESQKDINPEEGFPWINEEVHEHVFGEFQNLDLALVFDVILKAFGI
ncbi:hypothetical protein L211DRAFT_867977 [Terfezia boudieri ATCC MYA-4762]|uniref:Uncharacterized protein n=1 Tax=Terfezia boudieri ATCC MYA-4762 TaxID=1051890 RepID=A0A3N4LP27_9PEZI|nr:hypothetical protein L211DRAFT_867977 [Terfezia boudieri ATCC MYA-4762]